MDDITLVERIPTIAEFKQLRAAVGWRNASDEAIARGLPNTLFAVCLMRGDQVIGMGRVVGDGGIYHYIQDIVVLPDYQGQGLGRRIMQAIMDYLAAHVYPDTFVGLMAARGVSKFYESYGFAERPPDAPGMFRVWGT